MNNITSGGSIVRGGHNMYNSINMRSTSPQKSLGKISKRRFRSAFTTEQINYLEQQFKKCPYIINRKEISEVLQIPERAIKIWFQNRRMKEKKESSIKEFGNEATPNILAKDHLINVASTNEPQYSLSLISDDCPINGEGIIRNDTISLIIEKKPNDNESKIELQHPKDTTQSKKQEQIESEDTTSAKFSIDLYRKYKKSLMKSSNSSLMHLNSQQDVSKIQSDMNSIDCNSQKNEHTTSDTIKPAVTKVKYDFMKTNEISYSPYNTTIFDNKSVEYGPMKYEENEQLIPEDLSYSSKKYRSIDGTKKEKQTNSLQDTGFISVVPAVPSFYAQSYMQANGVIWKPVSLMPVVPTATSPVPSFLPKKPCNCDCHLSQDPYQQSQGPQYVFTLPFQNPSV